MTTVESIAITEIETADDAALSRWLSVRNAVDPRPLALAGFRAELTAATVHLELLATLDGIDVGAGGTGWGAISAEAKTAFLEAWVVPAARRRGVGSSLIDRSVAFAIDRGMVIGRASAVDGDEDSLRFAARYGLAVVGGGQDGFLDLTEVHAAPTTPRPDLEITSFAEHQELEHAVYDLDVLVQPEVSTLALEPRPSFEAWRWQTSGDPSFVADLSLIARRDGRVVGALQVYDNGEGTAFIGMAAVHPETRRQGIARSMKVELAARATRTGWHRLETFNDGTNERMRALNVDLGYVYRPRIVTLKGALVPRQPPSA